MVTNAEINKILAKRMRIGLHASYYAVGEGRWECRNCENSWDTDPNPDFFHSAEDLLKVAEWASETIRLQPFEGYVPLVGDCNISDLLEKDANGYILPRRIYLEGVMGMVQGRTLK